MEHHTPENMQQDIDFLVGLESDFVQFMLLTPLPVTALYQRHQRLGWIKEDLPFEEWHGQKLLNYRHPAFSEAEPESWINRAFTQDYHRNSSSMYRVAETSLRGFEWLAAIPERDACLQARLEQFEAQAREYCLMLPAIARFAVNDLERSRALALNERALRLFGRMPAEQAMVLAVIALVGRWQLHLNLFGDQMQPKTIVTHYRNSHQVLRWLPRPSSHSVQKVLSQLPAAAALLAPFFHHW